MPSSSRGRIFAVIPAAGRSRRMGRPKLLLPLGGRTILERLLGVLNCPGIADRIVVVHPDDHELARIASDCGARVIVPTTPPPEMRVSVETALRSLEEVHQPHANDGWLLIPADHPVLAPQVLDRLLDGWQSSNPTILVPTSRGRRGHPTLFRWRLAVNVFQLPPEVGLNRLVADRQSEVHELDVADDSIHLDLDTPQDYEQLLRQFGTEVDPHVCD